MSGRERSAWRGSAIVTGGSQGIGLAIGEQLRLDGYRVILADVVEPEQILDGMTFARLDVGDPAAWAALVADERVSGDLEVLVNNAGIGTEAGLLDTTLAEWERIIRVNQTGTLNGMRAVIPQLIRRGAGSVVNISSIYGAVATAFDPAYHASKAAVRQLTKHAAVAYGRYGVRVNAVLPGLIDTELTRSHTGDQNAIVRAQTPMRRGGEPREVAAAVAFLCSDQASFITGIDLPVDGGFLAQ